MGSDQEGKRPCFKKRVNPDVIDEVKKLEIIRKGFGIFSGDCISLRYGSIQTQADNQ